MLALDPAAGRRAGRRWSAGLGGRTMNRAPILLVEDNPDDVLMTRRALAKHNIGNEILVADDGELALDMLLPGDSVKVPLEPAVVLLDLHLPKIDGLEVLRRIRSDPRTAALRVVVLTTSDEHPDQIESYRLGANAYVHKPVMFDEFLDAARTLGLFWLLVQEKPPVASAR
jgi:two-component system, response regulator